MKRILTWFKNACTYTVCLTVPMFLIAYFDASKTGISLVQFLTILLIGALLSASQEVFKLKISLAKRGVLHFFACALSVILPSIILLKLKITVGFFIILAACAALYFAVFFIVCTLAKRRGYKTKNNPDKKGNPPAYQSRFS